MKVHRTQVVNNDEECTTEAFVAQMFNEGENAHKLIRAVLSHYIVKRKNNSILKASHLLKTSRNTLLDYLDLAEEFNVKKFFG